MKKLYYLVLDTETATLPFADEYTAGDANIKKKIAIAKPLIYDIGWTICDRAGNIVDKKQFLIAETFCVPSIFNTAYYAAKRPIYLSMLADGKTSVKTWNEVMAILCADFARVDAIGAFNSMFDFKRAIPFTELYISQLYSPNYSIWEQIQRRSVKRIAEGEKPTSDPDFDPNNFRFRGVDYPLFDLWGLSTTFLLNSVTYKNECIKHNLFTASGTFFKTSAESTFQYLCNKYDFVESHTALDDAEIETFILSEIAKRHAIVMGIKYFPFRDLGSTDDFCMRLKKPKLYECRAVYDAIAAYVDAKQAESAELSAYAQGLINRLRVLADYAGFACAY